MNYRESIAIIGYVFHWPLADIYNFNREQLLDWSDIANLILKSHNA